MPSSIACLGWGSLIWDPGDLPIAGEWQPDGPLLPLEFARISSKGWERERLTLVVVPEYSHRVTSLWITLAVDTPEEARTVLARREGTRERLIGLWRADAADPAVPEIATWARDRGLTAVVWTALGANFGETQDRSPTVDEAVTYLRGLTGQKRLNAEEYVRKAPEQIDTPYRRRFAAEFGWTPT